MLWNIEAVVVEDKEEKTRRRVYICLCRALGVSGSPSGQTTCAIVERLGGQIYEIQC